MKYRILLSILLIAGLTVPFSCSDVLEEEVYSELSDEFLKKESGISTLLYSMYNSAQTGGFGYPLDMFVNVYMAGTGWGQGGSWEISTAVTFNDFTWDANNGFSSTKWNGAYGIIRNANLILDKINEGDYSAELKSLYTAEAKGMRGYAYASLYNVFGPAPIFTTTETTDLERPRATDAEMLTRIETDLTEAAAALPVVPEQYGRITKGAALAFLCKHYLNTKQWQKSADAAEDIMDLGRYALQANYADVFGVANEENLELIWVRPADAALSPEFLNGLNFPADYPFPLPNQGTWATRTYWYDDFLDSFEANDTRLNAFVTSYVSTAPGVGTVVGYGEDKSLCAKHGLDPNAVAFMGGIDLPEIRYADIILARAEALNELNGPNQESIDLINMVRTRAGITSLTVGSFTKESLRDQILEERMHELFFEGHEREDMIRHGVLISNALARGSSNARDFHVLLPIPQTEIDANSNINENNSGY